MTGTRSDREEEDRWLSDWWDDEDEDDPLVEIASLLVLGLGLGALFGLVPFQPF